MVEQVIAVPSSQKKLDWFRFAKDSRNYRQDIDLLIVDFNDVRFMETDEFVILACIIESYFISGSEISFIGGTEGFNNHLYNIKFKEYWKNGFDRERDSPYHIIAQLCACGRYHKR
ncbi:hypothetical protein [Arenibacter latericius]|uniref:hypothetical protein n=1 Tax=Arenibacter latericius TaxID=86104 RepID=UPI000404E700|nr:hypothetical protein [Arenibacter latericius]